ncbi:MAG: hypothetical protein AAF787_01750 [Chloroflexota bacterium]
MSTITVIDNEHVVLYYHQHTKIIHHVYQPTIHGEYIKEQLNRGVELLKEHGAQKWLSDNHLFNDLPAEDSEWINTVWLPAAIEAGWKYWALVVPETDMGRMNMVQFINTFSEMGVKARVFVDPDKAMEWLIEIE